MDTVLILMASPGSGALDREALDYVQGLAGEVQPHWLVPREVLELPLRLPKADPRTIEDDIRAALGRRPIDIAVIAEKSRRKSLLIADMDSTFIRQECIDEIGAAAGMGREVAAITVRAMRGELDFEEALRARVALMKDLPATLLDQIISRTEFTPGGRQLVATMRQSGAYTALVSGGFIQFTQHVASLTGFHEHRANELIIQDGRLLGQVAEPILGRDAKISALDELTSRLGLSRSDAIAVGDGANDIGMIQAAGLGVAFHAKPAVRDAADVRIDYCDLTALLYLQGYKPAEFSLAS